jgi:hypothetical protein
MKWGVANKIMILISVLAIVVVVGLVYYFGYVYNQKPASASVSPTCDALKKKLEEYQAKVDEYAIVGAIESKAKIDFYNKNKILYPVSPAVPTFAQVNELNSYKSAQEDQQKNYKKLLDATQLSYKPCLDPPSINAACGIIDTSPLIVTITNKQINLSNTNLLWEQNFIYQHAKLVKWIGTYEGSSIDVDTLESLRSAYPDVWEFLFPKNNGKSLIAITKLASSAGTIDLTTVGGVSGVLNSNSLTNNDTSNTYNKAVYDLTESSAVKLSTFASLVNGTIADSTGATKYNNIDIKKSYVKDVNALHAANTHNAAVPASGC